MSEQPYVDMNGAATPSSPSSSLSRTTDSSPGVAERDGLMRGDNDDHHSPVSSSREGHQHHSTDSDFWSTVAGVAGNVLEWYDFAGRSSSTVCTSTSCVALVAHFCSLTRSLHLKHTHAVFGFFGDIIGEVFFPHGQEGDKSTMEAFLVFGLAFLMRPVGGVLLGYIGDLYGPKKALIISIFLMAGPTFAMGCLPTYDQVGALAIVLLVIVRMLQGLSVGGQLMSSLVFTLENHDPAQWGLYGSYVMAAANFGTLLGALAGTVLEGSLTEEQLISWGWRLPFLSGIVVSFSGFYLKSHGEGHHGMQRVSEEARPIDTVSEHSESSGGESEGDANSEILADTSGNPLRDAFRGPNLRPLAAASLVPMLWSAGFYISFVWM